MYRIEVVGNPIDVEIKHISLIKLEGVVTLGKNVNADNAIEARGMVPLCATTCTAVQV